MGRCLFIYLFIKTFHQDVLCGEGSETKTELWN